MRAAESVPANIVEGCFAASEREFVRFLDISIKSTGEVEYQLQLARDYGILPAGSWMALTEKAVEVRRMLFVLRRALLERRAMEGSRRKAAV